MKPSRMTIPGGLYAELQRHLFPGDGDEHGAVILAGTCESDRGLRLVAREIHLAQDGVDYVPGKRGYRMLKAEFIQSRILRARDRRLAYLAIHNHGGTDSVGFSPDDMASHERGYPALLDIARGMPVGALVFARSAVAGDLWFPGGDRAPLSHTTVIGHRRRLLFPMPERHAARVGMYDRQSRLFGDAGQELLRRTRVGIVGLGGAGSILAELLSRLGVGEFVLADLDRADVTNLPRLVGARRRDAVVPSWVPTGIAERLRTPKVRIAVRNIRRANRTARIEAMARDFLEEDVAAAFKDCDFLFLAADTMGARLLFNAMVHQYGIPGIQVGAKRKRFLRQPDGEPEQACLWCNGLISPGRLQDEAVPEATKRGYAYVNDPAVIAPSVISMNAVACAHAADGFLFHLMDLTYDDAETGWFRWNSRRAVAGYDMPQRGVACVECSQTENSRFGMGDNGTLPTRPATGQTGAFPGTRTTCRL